MVVAANGSRTRQIMIVMMAINTLVVVGADSIVVPLIVLIIIVHMDTAIIAIKAIIKRKKKALNVFHVAFLSKLNHLVGLATVALEANDLICDTECE